MTAYLVDNGNGAPAEALTIAVSAGAASADKIPATNGAGVLDPSILNAATTGPNKVALLDGAGRLDVSTLPLGTGQDVYTIQASEALPAGSLVNVWNSGGQARVRLADAATAKRADGFVQDTVANGAPAKVFFEGTLTGLSGLTAGDAFLGTAGAITNTPPSGAGVLRQSVGVAVSATALNFQRERGIIKAA